MILYRKDTQALTFENFSQWDHSNNPKKSFFEVANFKGAGGTVTYNHDAPDYCNVLSATPITEGRHEFEFVMHKIGQEQWCVITADTVEAGVSSKLNQHPKCWTYYCGKRGDGKGALHLAKPGSGGSGGFGATTLGSATVQTAAFIEDG